MKKSLMNLIDVEETTKGKKWFTVGYSKSNKKDNLYYENLVKFFGNVSPSQFKVLINRIVTTRTLEEIFPDIVIVEEPKIVEEPVEEPVEPEIPEE